MSVLPEYLAKMVYEDALRARKHQRMQFDTNTTYILGTALAAAVLLVVVVSDVGEPAITAAMMICAVPPFTSLAFVVTSRCQPPNMYPMSATTDELLEYEDPASAYMAMAETVNKQCDQNAALVRWSSYAVMTNFGLLFVGLVLWMVNT